MGHPGERQQMVLAQRVERDLARQHELVVALVIRKRREVERPRCEHLGIGMRDPARRVAKMLAARILPEGDEQIGHRTLSGVS